MFEWQRFLLGNAEPAFMLEVFVRTFFTFFLLMVVTRLLGRRTAAQYTLFDLSLVVTMSAAIGVPLQASDRGMLFPTIIALVIIGMQYFVVRATRDKANLRRAIDTNITPLVENGRLCIDDMNRAVIGQERLFEALRLQGIQHLGQVARFYMEPSGRFSLVRVPSPEPGLGLIPEADQILIDEARAEGWHACTRCGLSIRSATAPSGACRHCGAKRWRLASRTLAQ